MMVSEATLHLEGGPPFMNYVGIDYHKKYRVVTAVDKEGQIMRTCRLDNSPQSFHEFLTSLKTKRYEDQKGRCC